MKIAIVGYSGAGKSTLAKYFAGRYGLPLVYLDAINFISGWRYRDQKEALHMTKEAMDRDAWVIDGNYRNLYFEQRMEEADYIVYMDFPRWECLYRVIKRYLEERNHVRESAAEGCVEKMDLEFLIWVLWKGRSRRIRKMNDLLCENYREKIRICKNDRDVSCLKKEIERFYHGAGVGLLVR